MSTLPKDRAPSFQEAVDYAAARDVILPDVYYGKLAGVQRSQSVSIAGLASLEQIKAIIDLVRSVMDAGGTFADFQKKVKAARCGRVLRQLARRVLARPDVPSLPASAPSHACAAGLAL